METGGEHVPLLSRLRAVVLSVGAALLEGCARMDPGYMPEPPVPGSPEDIEQQVAAFRRDIQRM